MTNNYKLLLSLLLGLVFITSLSAQLSLTVDSTTLSPSKPPIFLKKKMIIYQNTPAYLVNPIQMDYLLSLHRFVLDSIPDMEFVAEAYTWLLEQKDKDYKALMQHTEKMDAVTLQNLNELNSMGYVVQNTLKDSQNRLNAALDKTLELQKNYRKRQNKSKIKRILNGVALVGTGAFVGYLSTKF